MSDSITKPDHRTLPRRKRPLSTRDQAILLAYRTQGRTQAQLAADFRLSQSRISQILRRAERLSRDQTAGAPSRDQTWSRSAENQPSTQNSPGASLLPANDDAQIPNPKSPIPNETTLDPATAARARAQDIFTRALRAFDHWPKELKTERHANRDGKEFDEETIRQQPPNSPTLRVALAAHRDLTRLEATSPSRDQTWSRSAADQPSSADSPGASLLPANQNSASLPRSAVEAWIVAQRAELDWTSKGYWQNYAPGLVDAILGQPNDGVGLDSLANQIGKTLVKKKEGNYNSHDGDGWYTAVYDSDGQFLRFFPSHELESQDADSGADIPVCQDDSVPGSSLGPHYPEAPASSSAACNPTCNLEPETCNSPSNPSTSSNPATAESAEVQSSATLPIQNPKSKIQNQSSTANIFPPPKPASPEVREYLDRVKRLNSKSYDSPRALLHDWLAPLPDPPSASA